MALVSTELSQKWKKSKKSKGSTHTHESQGRERADSRMGMSGRCKEQFSWRASIKCFLLRWRATLSSTRLPSRRAASDPAPLIDLSGERESGISCVCERECVRVRVRASERERERERERESE